MYLIDRLWLLRNFSSLNSPDYILAGYFLNAENLKTRQTLTSVQEETYISRSTIDRFCKELGFTNLRSFQSDLSAEFEERKLHAPKKTKSFHLDLNFEDYFNSGAIREKLTKIISIIRESDRIFLYGNQRDLYSFATFSDLCAINGKPVILLNDWSMKNTMDKLALCSKNDCLMIVDTDFSLKGYEIRMGLYEGLIRYPQLAKLPCKKIFIGRQEPDEDERFTVLGLPALKNTDEYRMLLYSLDIYLRERIG